MWFQALRTAFKLAGTVQDLNERLTALEGNFDVLDKAVKRSAAQARAQNSRDRKREMGIEDPNFPETPQPTRKVIGGIMRREKDGS